MPRAQGYRYCLVAENLAMNLDSRGFETRVLARDAVEGWKNSPGHRANMLQPTVTEIGVAVARAPDRDPKFISVQLFGRPEALKVEFRIENRAGQEVRYVLGEETHTLPARAIVTHTRLQPRAADVRAKPAPRRSDSPRATGIASSCARAQAAPSRSMWSGNRRPQY